jgi:ABC-type antimicrobial peptide transport system permease subunit
MGAIRGQVAGMVLRESLTLSAWGLLLGLMGAAAAAVLLRQHLFGVAPTDPLSFAFAVPTLTAAVLLAAWLPTQRATGVNPMEVLRD